MIPHVTQHDDADVTDLEALRKTLNKENEKAGTKLTMLAFLMKASVTALQKFPDFNASLDASGENLTLKKYFHIGFAARSEEHTSELQSLMRISYAVFCLKKKKKNK